MKLSERFMGLNLQTRWMIVMIVLLLVMIATRWDYITHTAGSALRERFTPPSEQTGSQAADPQ